VAKKLKGKALEKALYNQMVISAERGKALAEHYMLSDALTVLRLVRLKAKGK